MIQCSETWNMSIRSGRFP